MALLSSYGLVLVQCRPMVQLLSTLAIGTEKKLQMPIRPVRFGLECWMPTAASLRRNAMLAFPYEHHLLEPA